MKKKLACQDLFLYLSICLSEKDTEKHLSASCETLVKHQIKIFKLFFLSFALTCSVGYLVYQYCQISRNEGLHFGDPLKIMQDEIESTLVQIEVDVGKPRNLKF